MRIRILLPVGVLYILSSVACTSPRPVTHMIINNESNMIVPFNLSITHKGNNRQKTFTETLKPGIQEIAAHKFPRGSYAITAQTHNGALSIQKNLSLDSDRWIIITYTNDDSINISRKYGYLDTATLKKVNGKYAGLDMYVDSRKPPTLTPLVRKL